jgi:hypothetical protein
MAAQRLVLVHWYASMGWCNNGIRRSCDLCVLT